MPRINPSELPEKVGKSVFVPAKESEHPEANNEHYITLKNPTGRNTKVFNCEKCGKWYVSALNFERVECVS